MKSNLRDDLQRVEREIVIYQKGKEEPIKEINIDNIPFEELKNIISPKEDDPLLYGGYILDENQLEKIKHVNSLELYPDF